MLCKRVTYRDCSFFFYVGGFFLTGAVTAFASFESRRLLFSFSFWVGEVSTAFQHYSMHFYLSYCSFSRLVLGCELIMSLICRKAIHEFV